MNNEAFDLDDYISQRKEKDSDFAAGFDSGYEEFKIGMMIKKTPGSIPDNTSAVLISQMRIPVQGK